MNKSHAETLIDDLPLKEGVDKSTLVQLLELYISQIPRKKRTLHTNAREKKILNRITKAIFELESVLKDFEDSAVEFTEGKRTYKRYPTTLNITQLASAVKLLKPIRKACEARLVLAAKPGAITDVDSVEIGVNLATLYHIATGKSPALRSGAGKGPFYVFVESALDRTPFNAETVSRQAVKNWKSII